VGPPPGVTVRQVKAVAHERIQDYWRDMGMDDALFKAVSAVPFESQRFIGRDEIVRFGIDRSAFGEGGWELANNPNPLLIKRFFTRIEHDQQYIEGALIVDCSGGQSVRMGFMREHADSDAAASARSLSVSVNGQRFNLLDPVQAGRFDMRAASLPAIALEAASDSAPLELSGTYLGRNDATAGSVTLSMRGFSRAYAKLRMACDVAVRNAANAWLREASGWSPKPTPADALSIGNVFPPATKGVPPTWPKPPPVTTAAWPWSPAANKAAAPAQSESAPKACDLQLANAPEHVTGRVIALLSAAEALAQTRKAEAELGARISPGYLALRQAMVERYPRGDDWSTTAAIPQFMDLEVGDLVELSGRHRDQILPCHFIPWTIGRRIDQ
jgi:hypothetical protein